MSELVVTEIEKGNTDRIVKESIFHTNPLFHSVILKTLTFYLLFTSLLNTTSVSADPLPQFTDITEEAGIEFIHNNGAFGKKYLPETMGSGCAFLDYNSDGWQDILLVNGKDWAEHPTGKQQTLVSASDSYTNHQIHANINGHIISGRIDRLYKDQADGWQGLNYITFKGRDLEYYKPEMELYSLLLSKVYPNEPLVTINYIFTEQSVYEKMCFSSTDLLEISEKWQQKIISLQQGIYMKNLEHCCSCSYANSQGNCIVTES